MPDNKKQRVKQRFGSPCSTNRKKLIEKYKKRPFYEDEERTKILNGVKEAIKRNGSVLIIAPKGCGKSCLLANMSFAWTGRQQVIYTDKTYFEPHNFLASLLEELSGTDYSNENVTKARMDKMLMKIDKHRFIAQIDEIQDLCDMKKPEKHRKVWRALKSLMDSGENSFIFAGHLKDDDSKGVEKEKESEIEKYLRTYQEDIYDRLEIMYLPTIERTTIAKELGIDIGILEYVITQECNGEIRIFFDREYSLLKSVAKQMKKKTIDKEVVESFYGIKL